MRISVALASVIVLHTAIGCESAGRAGESDDAATKSATDSTLAANAGTNDSTAPSVADDPGLFGWLNDLNPFKEETRATVENYRVSQSTRPDGWQQSSLDIDLSRGDGPRSLLAAFTRAWRPVSASGASERLDIISLIVRDDPRRMMLFDDAPAYLVVARERIELIAMAPAPDSVKRAGDELQSRRSFRVPDGVLDRLVDGAPAQLIVMIGGREVVRTIPGAACAAIESAAGVQTTTPKSTGASTAAAS